MNDYDRNKQREPERITNAAISKATLMSFPLVGNLSEKPRRIVRLGGPAEAGRTSRNDRK